MLRGITWSLIPEDWRLLLWQNFTWVMTTQKNRCEWWTLKHNDENKRYMRLAVNASAQRDSDTSALRQPAMLFLILNEFRAPHSPSFSYPAEWIFPLLCSLSRSNHPARTRFQAWLSSFSPSVTRWSDPVYMQTYSLTPPFCWHHIASHIKATKRLHHCQARVGHLYAATRTHDQSFTECLADAAGPKWKKFTELQIKNSKPFSDGEFIWMFSGWNGKIAPYTLI